MRKRFIRTNAVIAEAARRRKPEARPRRVFQTDTMTKRLTRPLLIAIVATSLAIVALAVAEIINPGEPWLWLSSLCLLAALEGAYTSAWLKDPDSRGTDRALYRVAEIALLILAARVFSWLIFGDGLPSRADVRLYLESPSEFIATAAFFSTLAIVLVTWWFASALSRIFTEMDVSEGEVGHYTMSIAEQKGQADNKPMHVQRGELHKSYLQYWGAFGLIIVVLTALSTFEVRQFATEGNPFDVARLGLRPVVLLALLAYLLCGLWLLSHSRMLQLNATWLRDGSSKGVTLDRFWQRSSLLVLLAIAGVAAFLPIGSSLTISRVLQTLVNGIVYLISLIFSLLSYLFASVLTTFASEPQAPPERFQAPPPPMLQALQNAPAEDSIFALILSSAFWAILIAIMLGALVYFLRERGVRLERSQVSTLVLSARAWLAALWLRLRQRTRSAGKRIGRTLGGVGISSRSSSTALGTSRWRFVRLNSLSPRDQVRYFYLSTVRRAGERGLQRDENETPLEYAEALKEVWSDGHSDLDALTDAFLKARYSPTLLEQEDLPPVKEAWKRVKALLRRPGDRQ